MQSPAACRTTFTSKRSCTHSWRTSVLAPLSYEIAADVQHTSTSSYGWPKHILCWKPFVLSRSLKPKKTSFSLFCDTLLLRFLHPLSVILYGLVAWEWKVAKKFQFSEIFTARVTIGAIIILEGQWYGYKVQVRLKRCSRQLQFCNI